MTCLRSTNPPRPRALTNAEVAELRRCLSAAADYRLPEPAIVRRGIAQCRTGSAASSLITEYEPTYGPGCLTRGTLPGGKVRVVWLNPEAARALRDALVGRVYASDARVRQTRTRRAGDAHAADTRRMNTHHVPTSLATYTHALGMCVFVLSVQRQTF